MHIYFFQGQEFGNPGAVIEQHEDNLVIFIILHGPDPVNLFPGKFVPAVFVWVPVFVLRDIHVGGIIFVADIILQGKSVQLVKQDLYFLQCRIIFAAGIDHLLKIRQLQVFENPVVKEGTGLVGGCVSFYIAFRYGRIFLLRPFLVHLGKSHFCGFRIIRIMIIISQHLQPFGFCPGIADDNIFCNLLFFYGIDPVSCCLADHIWFSPFSG